MRPSFHAYAPHTVINKNTSVFIKKMVLKIDDIVFIKNMVLKIDNLIINNSYLQQILYHRSRKQIAKILCTLNGQRPRNPDDQWSDVDIFMQISVANVEEAKNSMLVRLEHVAPIEQELVPIIL